MTYSGYSTDFGTGLLLFENELLKSVRLPVKSATSLEEAVKQYGPMREVRHNSSVLLESYFKGENTELRDIRLETAALSPFTVKVLDAVRQIPYGRTKTYKWVAENIGEPEAARAVGAALNANPFLIVVPCHRVVKSNGEFGGYVQGLEWKLRLLKLEKAV